MCVIIYCPVEAIPITKEELSEAWDSNPDGAGFAIQRNGKVYYNRGFMDKRHFIEEVEKYIGKYNTLLHFRISTSNKVNKLQCHPYERSHIESLRGKTSDSVICMNGIVSCKYTDRENYNDTMNYIADHPDYFDDHINQHIIDMVGDVTGSKWFVMKPHKIYKTSDFTEHEGRWYSNKNHLYAYNLYKVYKDYYYDDPYDYGDYDDWSCSSKNSRKYKDYDYCDTFDDYDNYEYEYDYVTDSFVLKRQNSKNMIREKANQHFSKTMIKKLKKIANGLVWEDIGYFIKDYCLDKYNKCCYCDECFEDLKSKNEIVKKLEDAYGITY